MKKISSIDQKRINELCSKINEWIILREFDKINLNLGLISEFEKKTIYIYVLNYTINKTFKEFTNLIQSNLNNPLMLK